MREILEKFYILLSAIINNEEFASEAEKKVKPYLEKIRDQLKERLDRKDPITATEFTVFYNSNLMVIQTKIKSLTYEVKETVRTSFFTTNVTFKTLELPLGSALKTLIENCKLSENELKKHEASFKSNLMNENNTNQFPVDDEIKQLQAQLEAQKKEQEHKLEVEKLKAQLELQRLENEKQVAKAQLEQTQKQTQILQEQLDTLNTTVVELREQNEKLNKTLHEMSMNASVAEIPAISKTAFNESSEIEKLSQVISDERLKLVYHLLNLSKKLNNTTNEFTIINDLIDDLLLNYKKPIAEIIHQEIYKDLINHPTVKSRLLQLNQTENNDKLKAKLAKTEIKLAKLLEKNPSLKANGYNLEVHTLLAIKGVYKPKSGTSFFYCNNLENVLFMLSQKVKFAEKNAKSSLLEQQISSIYSPVKKQKLSESTQDDKAHTQDLSAPVFQP